MNLIIQSLGFTAGESLEGYVHEKMSKLDSMAQDAIRAEIMLFMGPESDPNRYHCEIRLEVPGNDPFVKKHGPSFEQAVVDCVDALQSMLRKHKEMAHRRKHSNESTDTGLLPESEIQF